MAEHLHTPVYELKANMPASEYMAWNEVFADKEKERKVREKMNKRGKGAGKNLLAGSTDDLIAGLTGNG